MLPKWASKGKPNRASCFVGDHLIAKMSKMMRKGLSMKNPILSRIDEDEVAVAPAADAGSRPHYQRVHSWESGRGRNLSSGSGKIAGCDNDINECAEAFIRRFRQQLQLQRRHSMGNFEKMMSVTENWLLTTRPNQWWCISMLCVNFSFVIVLLCSLWIAICCLIIFCHFFFLLWLIVHIIRIQWHRIACVLYIYMYYDTFAYCKNDHVTILLWTEQSDNKNVHSHFV